MEHRHLRLVWMLFALAVVLFIVAPALLAAPRFMAQADDVSIVLHDEPCAFKDKVTNLPFRATWHEADKVVEGCWTVNGADIVMLWFEDRTVAGLPKDHFERIGKT